MWKTNILHACKMHCGKEEIGFDGSVTFGVIVARNEAKEAEGRATIIRVCRKWNWLLGFTEYLLEIEQHIRPVAKLVEALHQIQITKNNDENGLTRNFELTT